MLIAFLDRSPPIEYDVQVQRELCVGDDRLIVHGRATFVRQGSICEVIHEDKISKHHRMKCALLLSLFPESVEYCELLNISNGSNERLWVQDRVAFLTGMFSTVLQD